MPQNAGPVNSSAQTPICKLCRKETSLMCSACGPSFAYCSVECQKNNWNEHANVCKSKAQIQTSRGNSAQNINERAQRNGRVSAEDVTDLEETEDLKFYIKQIYFIVLPVMACILLSLLWVKISMSGSDFRPSRDGFDVFTESDTASLGENLVGSLINASIIIAQIVAATVIIVLLFKYGQVKILIGFFVLTVIMLLGFMGYLLLLNIIQVFRIPLDYITMIFCLYNFAAGGLVAIFWKAPLYIEQAYLVVMSSLMAFSLTGLQAWTTWMLLALLAIWDLIAVLCPFGPLKMLIESSREQNRDVPALLYSVTMVWFMAQPPSDINVSDAEHPSVAALTDIPKRVSSIPNGESLSDMPPLQEIEERSGLKLGLGDFVFYSVLVARASMSDWVTTVACIVAVMSGLTLTIFLLALTKRALPALPISIALGILFYFISSYMVIPYVANANLHQLMI